MLIPRMRGKAELKKGKDRPLVMQLIRRHCVPLHAVALDPSSTEKAKFTGGICAVPFKASRMFPVAEKEGHEGGIPVFGIMRKK